MTVRKAEIKTQEALDDLQRFLHEHKLPSNDLSLKGNTFIGYYQNDELVGTGGLEIYGPYALLRSIAVKESLRGNGLGIQIVSDLILKADELNIKKIFLLTETAHDFFLKQSFNDVNRSDVPELIKASSEFAHVCPVTSAAMVLEC